MRLIDADVLLEAIGPMCAEGCLQMEKLIKLQPTVYDVDELVDDLADQIANQRIYYAGLNDCSGCAFKSVEEWEMPCARCKRNCKDYYRHKASEE